MNREGSSSDKDNDNLETDDNELNTQEPVVFENAFENIEAIVQSTTAVKISC